MELRGTLFSNARLTNDSTDGLYDVRVENGVVAAISPHGTDEARNSKSYAIFDVGGLYLASSMVDHHVHFSVWARARKRISLAGVNTLSLATSILSKALKSLDANQPALVGANLHLGNWSTLDISLMTRETLDEHVSAGIPIIIYMNDLHSCWCNTAAMQLLKVNRESVSYRGVLLEKECFDGMAILDDLQRGTMLDDIKDACIEAAKKGVTEIVDLDIDRNVHNWPGRVKEGLDYLRIRCGIYTQYLDDVLNTGLKTGDDIAGGNGLLTVGPYKIISDGSLAPNDHGLLSYTPEEFKRMFTLANNHKLQLAIHAIGDRTHTVIFDAFDSLGIRPLPGSTIEHAQLLQWSDVTRFADYGLIASIQPQHQNDDRELAERFWPTCTDRAFPYKTLVDAGIRVKLGSDAPVAPLDPWLAISAAISRRREGEKDEDAWHPEQRIGVEIAYQGSTSNGKLVIEVGDRADVCILDKDPLKSSVDEIRHIKVAATMLGGRFTWNGLDESMVREDNRST